MAEETTIAEKIEKEVSKRSNVTTTELVDLIFSFSEFIANKTLFAYQAQPAKRIIRSIIENDGETLTMFFSRQSGKSTMIALVTSGCAVILPILANMPMFLEDERLKPFKNGFLAGIFAPALHQAQICFNNVKDNLSSDHALTILDDPEIHVGFQTNNGQNIELYFKNLNVTSKVTCMSASDKSNIEGKSFMLVIVDEAQDVSNFKYSKSISPMVSWFNGSKVLIGTPTITRNFFFDTIEQNKQDELSGNRRKTHFEYDWKTVVRYRPQYGKHIENEKRRLGADSDEFMMSYCVAPETKILTSDLRWIRADSIKKGYSLAGFDEEPPKRYAQRRFKKATVEDVGKIKRPCYRLTFDDGTVVVCSKEHQWLTFTAGSRTEWTKTEDLAFTDRVYRPITPWATPESSYGLGYLSAAFDGEGHVSQIDGKIGQVCFNQKNNVMMEKVKKYLDEFGFKYEINEKNNANVLYLIGGRDAYFRFLGTIRPERILNKFNLHVTGTLRYCGHDKNEFSHPRLVSKEYVGMREVIAIRTDTRTYIAEGLASHNCLKWIFERGMFIDPDHFEKLGEDYERVFYDMQNVHVAGIDLGKQSDSTVVTILEVDWERPIVIEQAKEANAQDFVVYNTKIKDWLEIQGDNWNEQYVQILDYLGQFKIERAVIDATGVGNPIFDRLSAALPFETIPYVFSMQSKSMLFKHGDSQIKSARVKYPCGEQTRESREFQRFIEQMLTAEKSYTGQHMVVAAPKERNAHDDYPTSLMLALWAAKGNVDKPVTEKYNPFVQKYTNTFYKKRNRLTAKRM